jgi:hypothetical protein
MKRTSSVVARAGLFLLSPTRFVVDSLKNKYPALFLRWPLLFAALTLVCIPIFLVVRPEPIGWPFTWRSWTIAVALFLLPWSRITEIVWAFFNDANARLRRDIPRTSLTTIQRLRNLLVSYLELIIDFAILYFFLPRGEFKFASDGLGTYRNFFQAVYFSAMTLTTTGYGDIAPRRWTSELLCMLEPLAGLLLVVLGIGAYLGTIGLGQPAHADIAESPKVPISASAEVTEVLSKRIEELNNKCTQILMFLSFAIAAAVLLWTNAPNPSSAQSVFVHAAMKRWVWAIFPILLGIAPLKEFREDNASWYGFLRWMKFLALWTAIGFIAWGAIDFVRAL